MMRTLLATFLITYCLPASAQTPDSRPGVNTTDDAYDVPSMRENARVTVDHGAPAWGVSQEFRNLIFEKSGLSSAIETEKLDQIDQDLLFEELKTKTIEELARTYPSFPKHGLQSAKKFIRAFKVGK